ncbi:MAG TPA: hypothetical protein VFV83_10745, partial [Chthoniobacteraceae bacterium]|nr:hypothetical protein [Chthoniobacteraceae bacterium]
MFSQPRAIPPTLLLVSLLGSAFGADDGDAALDPRKPLVYWNEHGALAPVTTAAEWNSRRRDLFTRMQQVMGPLARNDKRTPLDMKTVRESDGGSYVIRDITFASEPGSVTPALLLIPKNALASTERQTRAVLCLHP